MDKPMVKSTTAWGAAIAGVAEIANLIGTAMQQGIAIDYVSLSLKVLTVIGLVVAAIGWRKTMGAIITK